MEAEVERQTRVAIASAAQREAVCELDALVLGNDSRREYLEARIRDGQCFILMGDSMGDLIGEQKLLGYAVVEMSFYGNAFLSLLIVHPDARKMGVGSELLLFAEQHSPTEKLFTSTNESNVKMQNLLAKWHYVKSGWIDNLDEGDPEIVYFKRLNTHA